MGTGVKLGPSLGPTRLCTWCSSVFGEGQGPGPVSKPTCRRGWTTAGPTAPQPSPLAQALNKNLTMVQHTQLVLTLMHGLCSRSHLHSDLAAELLQMILGAQGVRQEQVGAKSAGHGRSPEDLAGKAWGGGGRALHVVTVAAEPGRRWAPRMLPAVSSKQPCLQRPEAGCP